MRAPAGGVGTSGLLMGGGGPGGGWCGRVVNAPPNHHRPAVPVVPHHALCPPPATAMPLLPFSSSQCSRPSPHAPIVRPHSVAPPPRAYALRTRQGTAPRPCPASLTWPARGGGSHQLLRVTLTGSPHLPRLRAWVSTGNSPPFLPCSVESSRSPAITHRTPRLAPDSIWSQGVP